MARRKIESVSFMLLVKHVISVTKHWVLQLFIYRFMVMLITAKTMNGWRSTKISHFFKAR